MRPVLRNLLTAVLAGTVLAATPVQADDFPVGCVFYKASSTGYHGEDIQFMPGEAFSIAQIHDGYGKKPTYCLFSIETIPFIVTCHGKVPEPFSFVGPTMDVQSHDILIFRNTAWYKFCYQPLRRRLGLIRK